MRIPSVEDVGRLVAHAASPRVSTRQGFAAYVALCAFAGLRKGEAAAVQVGDVDFLRRQPRVTRQLRRGGCSPSTGSPCTTTRSPGAGAPPAPPPVQRALGHAAATTTLNTSSHLWPTAKDRTRRAAAGLMRQASRNPGIAVCTGEQRR